jgi:glycosyltransferase involved in cell wall biosynthesis
MIRSVAIVIPAANEETLIGPCLDAIAAARSQVRRHAAIALEIRTVVVLDSCTDATESAAREHDGVETVACSVGRVGAARALGVRHLLARCTSALSDTWIANTDSDSQVPTHWLTHMVHEADRGAHLVLGTVLPADGLSPLAHRRWLDHHKTGDGHGHIHGANFGIRADVYQALGGWPPLASGEDVTLARQARAARYFHTVRTGAIPVTTSARLTGRAPHGFADYLQDLVDGIAAG